MYMYYTWTPLRTWKNDLQNWGPSTANCLRIGGSFSFVTMQLERNTILTYTKVHETSSMPLHELPEHFEKEHRSCFENSTSALWRRSWLPCQSAGAQRCEQRTLTTSMQPRRLHPPSSSTTRLPNRMALRRSQRRQTPSTKGQRHQSRTGIAPLTLMAGMGFGMWRGPLCIAGCLTHKMTALHYSAWRGDGNASFNWSLAVIQRVRCRARIFSDYRALPL